MKRKSVFGVGRGIAARLTALLLTAFLLGPAFPFVPLTAGANDVEGYYTYICNDKFVDGYYANTRYAQIIKCDPAISGDVVLPSTLGGYPVEEIGWEAFIDCTQITSVTLPETMRSIGERAFMNCTDMVRITIPESVCQFGMYAFSGCTSLQSITISGGVEFIPADMFLGCASLTEINVDKSNSAYQSVDGVLFSKDMETLKHYPAKKTNTSYAVPDGVTLIDEYSFSGCANLQSITIPGSVTVISDGVFTDCERLAEINVDENNSDYKSIDGVLFTKELGRIVHYPAGKTNTSYVIPDGVMSIGNYLFAGRTRLTEVMIPDSVTDIGSYAFAGCTGLTHATIPDSVERLDWYVFSGCTSLKSVTVPECTSYIFSGCTSLTDVTISECATLIDSYAFSGCTSLTSVTIPNNVTTIYTRAFEGCTSLTEVTIPDSVTEIGVYAFSGCTSLTGVTIPDSVMRIDRYAFSDCTSLTSIAFPNSVTNIGDFAFAGCTSLTSVTISGEWIRIGYGAFKGCTGLTEFCVAENQLWYKSVNGVLFTKDMETLVCYPAGKTNTRYTIPDGVKSIDDFAFFGCTSLTRVTVPDSVGSLAGNKFSGCENLILYCYEDTTAHQYAIDWGIPYVLLNEPDVSEDAGLSQPAGESAADSQKPDGDGAVQSTAGTAGKWLPWAIAGAAAAAVVVGAALFCVRKKMKKQ